MRRMMTVRKPKLSALVLVTVLFGVFTLGYFLGMSRQSAPLSVTVAEDLTREPREIQQVTIQTESGPVFPVSINRADKDDLAALPGIGDVLARRIVDYRRANGYFTSPEELLNVEGIGEKKLEAILDLIVIGG